MEYSKFECEKCQFKCGFISHWNDHIISKKHTGEKRKERCDKILYTNKNDKSKITLFKQARNKRRKTKRIYILL